MGIFNLIILIPVVLLYLSVGWIYLRLTGKPINRIILLVFVISGGFGGLLSMITYAAIVTSSTGRFDSAVEIIGMFLVSGVSAILSSIIFTNIAVKYNKSLNLTGAKNAPPS